MKNFLPKLVLILPLLFITTHCQVSADCSWKDPNGNQYSFSSLQKEEGWKIRDLGTTEDSMFAIKIIFNFCKEMTPKCNLDGSIVHAGVYEALEVLGQETDTCEVLGKYDSQTISTVKYGEHQEPGVNFTYGNGDLCFGSENSAEDGKARKTSFIILCGAEDEWVQSPVNALTVTKCSKEFVIHHPSGCVGGVPGSTGGVSWLKLLIFIGIIYLIGGCIYNQLNFGKKGVDAIPHLDFWRALPTIIVEGCKYVIGKIKTLTSKYSSESTTSGGSRPKASGGYLNL